MNKCRFYDICPAVKTYKTMTDILLKGGDQNEINRVVFQQKQNCERCKMYEKEGEER